MRLLTVISGLSTLSNLAIAALLFFKGRTKRSSILFACVALTLAIWCASCSVFSIISRGQLELAFLWWQIGYIGVIFIPIFYAHFVYVFLGLKRQQLIRIGYLSGIIFLFFNWVKPHLFLRDLRFVFNRFYWHDWVANKNILFLIFVVGLYGILLLYAFFLLIQHFRHSKGIARNQLKYLILGSAIGWIGGEMHYGIVFRLDQHIPYYPFICFALFLTAVYPSIIAYGIIKYRLMDINIAITRAGIFALVYSLVLGIPFWWGYTTKYWFSSTILAIFLATLGPLIYSYLRHHAEELILKHQRRYQRALRELSRTMTRIRDLDKLMRMIVLTVVDTVKVPYAGIYLKDEEYKHYRLKHYYPKTEKNRFPEFISFDSSLIKIIRNQKKPIIHEELERQVDVSWESGLVIPCFMEDELLGFLVMGAKPHNHIYTGDDVIVFETLSYSTGLAIENCRFWKEIEDRQRKARLQEMDTYSYSLAHEIDNPMQIIMGHTELLQRYICKELNLPPEKQKEAEEAFGYIIEAAKRVSSMVKAIRDFGQKTTGELLPLKVEDVVESFSRLYFPQFKVEGVNFSKELPSEDVYIRGEKPELMQVLVILTNNSLHAMRYTEDKRIFLKVEQSNSDTVRIIFQDNGCGIKKELLPIIFSPFTTTKASSEGTGMGLYNAKKIIERHKGKIWAESEGEDKGATFIIELAVAKDVSLKDLGGEDKGKRLF